MSDQGEPRPRGVSRRDLFKIGAAAAAGAIVGGGVVHAVDTGGNPPSEFKPSAELPKQADRLTPIITAVNKFVNKDKDPQLFEKLLKGLQNPNILDTNPVTGNLFIDGSKSAPLSTEAHFYAGDQRHEESIYLTAIEPDGNTYLSQVASITLYLGHEGGIKRNAYDRSSLEMSKKMLDEFFKVPEEIKSVPWRSMTNFQDRMYPPVRTDQMYEKKFGQIVPVRGQGFQPDVYTFRQEVSEGSISLYVYAPFGQKIQ